MLRQMRSRGAGFQSGCLGDHGLPDAFSGGFLLAMTTPKKLFSSVAPWIVSQVWPLWSALTCHRFGLRRPVAAVSGVIEPVTTLGAEWRRTAATDRRRPKR